MPETSTIGILLNLVSVIAISIEHGKRKIPRSLKAVSHGHRRHIQAEHDQRTNNRTARLLSQARFRYNASTEELTFDAALGRDKKQILSLATCEYIKQGESVLVTCPAGVGKSFIASALGHQACFA